MQIFYKRLLLSCFACMCLLNGFLFSSKVQAQNKTTQATWIWYPGDFEVWLSNQMQNRRTERGTFFPPFWRMDSHYVLVEFHKEFNLTQPEEIELFTEGQYNVKLNGKMLSGYPKKLQLAAGKQKINIKVYAQDKVPAIYINGKTVKTDASWLATFEDKEWIDETGKASDASGTTYVNAGTWNFNLPNQKPSTFKLSIKPKYAIKTDVKGASRLIDFGEETFGFIKLHGLKGNGQLRIYYGESKEEALSSQKCETFDFVDVNLTKAQDSTLQLSKAFRYVQVETDAAVKLDSVSMLYEYLPVKDRGTFTSSDAELNKIWQVSKYTMELTTREFFIDGIKRDRWMWSGDAYQSYLMNYYLGFDEASVRRTILALRGKDPVTSHINTIMDYTFYWFLSIQDYYQYTGDKQFINLVYPKMKSLMDFCLQRRNQNGFMQGLSGDWIFIDWADGLSKQGEVSFEQLLLCRSLETIALCADLAADDKASAYYKNEAMQLKTKFFNSYWNADKQAIVHSRIDGKQTENVTRYANMFAIFFDYLNAQQKEGVKKNVLLNDKIQKIMTPYMRFYELEALCAMGEHDYVMKEMKNYWGGMLKLGATSFWEEYNPSKKDTEHYAMYGREFGKSLCHSWGASPVYLLGKYYLGVKPLTAGYQQYLVEPHLGGLQWMQGTVPTPNGDISLYCSTSEIKIKADSGTGTLRLKSKTKPQAKGISVKQIGQNYYELSIPSNKEYIIKYKL
ncbi:alpha-L-rhamnosidase-related protein [Pedobacter puniceum]|uniref:Bacterial alpha-L-rhamnosidase n=1 Tax=Pedobacter puniceum TaxID=2666136 RepID=A0A7K0FL12_9SPHI|nr:family 78 glycoside hydrolase catalytic domain [Pedobacter puniceum]MRX46666.1 Bacterial alpha-L-rhamnosidase [Pedobacter puniceum]